MSTGPQKMPHSLLVFSTDVVTAATPLIAEPTPERMSITVFPWFVNVWAIFVQEIPFVVFHQHSKKIGCAETNSLKSKTV